MRGSSERVIISTCRWAGRGVSRRASPQLGVEENNAGSICQATRQPRAARPAMPQAVTWWLSGFHCASLPAVTASCARQATTARPNASSPAAAALPAAPSAAPSAPAPNCSDASRAAAPSAAPSASSTGASAAGGRRPRCATSGGSRRWKRGSSRKRAAPPAPVSYRKQRCSARMTWMSSQGKGAKRVMGGWVQARGNIRASRLSVALARPTPFCEPADNPCSCHYRQAGARVIRTSATCPP